MRTLRFDSRKNTKKALKKNPFIKTLDFLKYILKSSSTLQLIFFEHATFQTIPLKKKKKSKTNKQNKNTL